MADFAEDVKTALADLRDAAHSEYLNDSGTYDLRPVAEAYHKFEDAWVAMRVDEMSKEENPDGVESDDKSDDETRTVEIDEKVELKPATPAPATRKSSK